MKIEVWTATTYEVEEERITTTVHEREEDAYLLARRAFDPDNEFDDLSDEALPWALLRQHNVYLIVQEHTL